MGSSKKYRIQKFSDELIHTLSHYFDITVLQTNSYRIVSRVNDKMVDYYPKSQRAFLLKEQKWGVIDIDELEDKLKKYLKHE
jgi:predicted RNA-binding protein associated with RNAse of E/G family